MVDFCIFNWYGWVTDYLVLIGDVASSKNVENRNQLQVDWPAPQTIISVNKTMEFQGKFTSTH